MRRSLVAACAAATVAVAGCAPAAAPSLQHVRLSAAEVLQQTAQKAEEVTSYSADFVVELTTAKGEGDVQGTMRYQKTPQIATDLTLDEVALGGRSLPGGLRVIQQGDVAYVKAEALKRLAGSKPWIKLNLRELGSRAGVDVESALSRVQQFDLKSSVAMLTASDDVKPVGTEQVGGVDTTHYSGTFSIDEAVKRLPADSPLRIERRHAELKDITFDAWIDGDGLPRKVQFSGGRPDQGTFTATALFKSFNEPVAIEAPPADQIGELPHRQDTAGG